MPVSPEALANLHPSDLFRIAFQASGLETRDLLKAMHWSRHFWLRVLGTEKLYPSFPDIPEFCRVTGSLLPIQWLEARAAVPPGTSAAPLDCSALLVLTGRVTAKLGKAAHDVDRAVADNRLTLSELRLLLKDVESITSASLILTARLREAERRAPRG